MLPQRYLLRIPEKLKGPLKIGEKYPRHRLRFIEMEADLEDDHLGNDTRDDLELEDWEIDKNEEIVEAEKPVPLTPIADLLTEDVKKRLRKVRIAVICVQNHFNKSDLPRKICEVVVRALHGEINING